MQSVLALQDSRILRIKSWIRAIRLVTAQIFPEPATSISLLDLHLADEPKVSKKKIKISDHS